MTTTFFYLLLQMGILMGDTDAQTEETFSTDQNNTSTTTAYSGGGDWDDGD